MSSEGSAATDPLRARLLAARLYLVCDARPGGRDLSPFLHTALRGGVDIVQLRDPRADDARLLAAAPVFRRAADEAGALFILNDRPDLVEECGADGVHLGQDDVPVQQARALLGPDPLIGLSTHSPEQVDAAPSEADYIAVGPVHATPTKPGRPAIGLEPVGHAARHAHHPFFAIGGIDGRNVHDVIGAGARRIVVVRALTEASSPERAARTLAGALAGAGPREVPVGPAQP